jgi:hypothetical protein
MQARFSVIQAGVFPSFLQITPIAMPTLETTALPTTLLAVERATVPRHFLYVYEHPSPFTSDQGLSVGIGRA